MSFEHALGKSSERTNKERRRSTTFHLGRRTRWLGISWKAISAEEYATGKRMMKVKLDMKCYLMYSLLLIFNDPLLLFSFITLRQI
jgi:hypothetical protein